MHISIEYRIEYSQFYILTVSVFIFPSLFCPSARMTKWCVPEPKKFSVSLRRRRSTSCDHSDQPQLNINTINDGLLWSYSPVPLFLHLHPLCQRQTQGLLKAAGSSFGLILMWLVDWKSFKLNPFNSDGCHIDVTLFYRHLHSRVEMTIRRVEERKKIFDLTTSNKHLRLLCPFIGSFLVLSKYSRTDNSTYQNSVKFWLCSVMATCNHVTYTMVTVA